MLETLTAPTHENFERWLSKPDNAARSEIEVQRHIQSLSLGVALRLDLPDVIKSVFRDNELLGRRVLKNVPRDVLEIFARGMLAWKIQEVLYWRFFEIQTRRYERSNSVHWN
jgi:hypothetical protein